MTRRVRMLAAAAGVAFMAACGSSGKSGGTPTTSVPSRPANTASSTAVGPSSGVSGTTSTAPTATSGVPTGTPSSGSTASTGSDQWLTYHRDAMRSGNDPSEPPVSTLRQAWRTAVDGQLYGEPLVDANRVIVATEHNTVYSIDATTGKIQWSTNLGTPMPGAALPCGNIDPSGITGTPVIDPDHGLVWVVAFVQPGRHELIGVDLANGAVHSRRVIELPGVDERAEQQRAALTLHDGNVYAAFGGLFGDCGNYRGFVVGIPASGAGAQLTFPVPTAREGAIWAPPGPVLDHRGNLLVATGNGASTTTYDHGDSVLALSPALHLVDSFAPANWVRLNEADLDLGSVSPTVVGNDIFQIGKEGVGYLLDAGHLGGVGGQGYFAQVCARGALGGTAVDGTTVFIPCRSGLVAVQVGPGPRFHRVWQQPSVTSGTPIVAAGHVWVLTRGGQLAMLDEHTGAVQSSQQVGSGATSFPSLSVAGGRLFAPAGDALVAFGGV